MKGKKLLSLLLAAVMTVSAAACGDGGTVTNNTDDDTAGSVTGSQTGDTEQAAEEANDTEAETVRPDAPTGQLIVGTITDLENEFYDATFSNSSANYQLYSLLHGYATVTVTKDGEWITDPTVVAGFQTSENEDGTKTFTMTLNDGLVWTDGSRVTAKDYVFALLLESSPEMMGVDHYAATGYTFLDGWESFNSGETKSLKGVHLLNELTFSVTVSADELPYHYDLAFAAVTPRPLAVIAPGCDIVDSEEGASISGDFTTEVLLATINDPDTGYRFNPQVTCGPYRLESYDASSRQGTVVVNELYAGNYAGTKPVIERVIIKTISEDTQINELQAGTVDLLTGISGGETIEAGLDLVDEGLAQKHSYFRYGYGMLKFDCSRFPTDSVRVRQAIALCLDRNEFARIYSGGYATIVHGEYGLSQWEYQDSKDWLDENLNTYEKDIEAAKEKLAADGWTLAADGSEYQDGDGTRYKEVDGELVPLVIEWCNVEGNPVAELLATMLPEAMGEAGMELAVTTTDFPTLRASLDHKAENMYNMYNMGSNFSLQHSPWYYFSTDEHYMGSLNSNWISDEELSEAALALKTIPIGDQEQWLLAWQNYQKVWNEKLPNIPLYSDEYHDFYSNKLKGWDTSSLWSWENAILDAWVTE